MSALNLLLIGDPHIKITNITTAKEMINQIIQIVKDKLPDGIVILGDILDTHGIIHMIPLVTSVDFIRQLQDLCKVYLIIGNHDRKNNRVYLTENEHPFSALKYWENIEIIDTIKWITVIKNNQSYNFTMVPYVEPGRFHEALELIPQYKKSLCIFCHQEFMDAQMGCFTSVSGDVWPEENPYIISGHIHDGQQLQNNILYIGVPTQHSFGDKDDKYIALLSVSDKISNHNECFYEKIKLKLPLKKIIHLKYKEVSKYKLEKDIEAKIIITCTLIESKTLMKHVKIIEWKKMGVIIVYKELSTDQELIEHDYNRESFTTLLYNNIKNDQPLLNTYTETFGALK